MDIKPLDAVFVEYMKVGSGGRLKRYLSRDFSDDTWCGESGIELYRSVYKFYGLDLDSCPVCGPMFFDLDGDLRTRKVFKALKQSVRALINWFKAWGLCEQEIEIYFSGSKGFHVIVPEKVLDIKPSEDLNRINKTLAVFLKNELGIGYIDTGIYDRRRVLRLPGSVNFKTGLYKLPLPFDEFDGISLKNLKEVAAVQPLKNGVTRRIYAVNKKAAEKFVDCTRWARSLQAEKDSSKSLDTMNLSGNSQDDSTMNLSVKEEKARRFLPCVEKALSSDCMEGRRNKTAFLIASSLIQRKIERVKIKELILRWNRNLSEPMDDNEAENVIIKAFLNSEKGKNHYGCGVFQGEGLCVGNCNFRTMNLSGKGKTE